MHHTEYSIGVITNVHGHSMQQLEKLSEKHGVRFETVPFSHIPLTDLANSAYIKKLLSYDIIYYRTGLRDSAIYEIARILEARGVPVINAGTKHERAHRKIVQALLADRYKIRHPKSLILSKFNYDVASKELGEHFVVKPDGGSHGSAVTLVKSESDLQTLKENKRYYGFIYQELIEGADEYRVYTIGDRGVASYKKVLGDNDFRANLHAGASMTTTEPEREPALLSFAGHVAKCFGADISGVDVWYKDGECILVELNWQPGWENLNELTGVRFSKETLQYLLNRAHEAKLRI